MNNASRIADEAVKLLSLPTIPYVAGGSSTSGADCQGLVKLCCSKLGTKLNYRGSNDMYRNACSWVSTLAAARSSGRLKPGAVLFIVDHNGGEPEQYKNDGAGNASHIGIYCGAPDAEVVHASSSRGMVTTSTLKNAWTHVGWLKGFDYENRSITVVDELSFPDDLTDDSPAPMEKPTAATVYTEDGGSLKLRKNPTTTVDNRVGTIPNGEGVKVVSTRKDGWTQVSFKGVTGWVKSDFLQFEQTESQRVQASVQRAFAAPSVRNSTPYVSVQEPDNDNIITIRLDAFSARVLYDALDFALHG